MRAEDIDLGSMLEFRPDLGQVLLKGQRMLIFSQRALGLLYESLATHLGHELTAAIFAQFGARSGREDYQAIADSGDWETDLDRISSGPVIHMWEGLVHVTPTALDYDREQGRFFMAGEWRHSYEAANYLDRYGASENPVCWALTGYATGWSTEFFGAEVLAIETSCVAAGADLCRFEIRQIDAWDSRADPWRQAQKATPQFVTSYMEAKVAQRTSQLTAATRKATAAQHAAEDGLRAKSEVLARTSHELRTPLNSVIEFAGRLRETDLDAEQRHLVDLIIDAGAQQLDVVSDLLDYVAPKPGDAQVDSALVHLPDLLDTVVRVATPLARAKGVTLRAEPPSADLSRVPITTDALRLQQILNALISNAIKFTPRGGAVDLSATLRPHAVAVSVTDTGVGMSDSTVASLFEPFEQAVGTKGSTGGTGLGLTISRELAETIGARIEVTSRVGEGSCFTVLLPRNDAVDPPLGTVQPTPLGHTQEESRATSPLPPPDPSEPEPISALVADDNRINAVVITKMLESMNVKVTTVADGQAAIAAFNSDDFDLIVLDLHMPNLDGVDVVRHIRIAEVDQGIPAHLVAALTADVLEETRKRCLAAGFSEFMTKPVRRDAIADLIARAEELRSARRH